MEKILLFIPAYNCEKQITRVLDQLDSSVTPYLSEIIVINNCSTDGTEEGVKAYALSHPQLPIKLFRNQSNYNLGGSHKVAFNYAVEKAFDYIIVLHGDDQGDIHDLLPILSKQLYHQHDCCLGARFQKNSNLKGYSAFRTVGNIIFNLIFSVALKRKIYDLGSGLNLYSVKMLKHAFYLKYPDRLTFNYCMIMAAQFYHHDLYFFPISWREDDQLSNVKITSQAFNVLGMLMKYIWGRGRFLNSELREQPVDQYLAHEVSF